MNFDWDLEPGWWVVVGSMAVVSVVLLVLAIVAFVSYRSMRRQRDEVRDMLEEARQVIAEIQTALAEARRDRDEALRELERARTDWQGAIRKLAPRLTEQAGKISEVMEGLARWQEDRRRIGLGGGWELRAEAVMKAPQQDRERLAEALANFRKGAGKSIGALRRLVQPKGARGGDHTEAENPPPA